MIDTHTQYWPNDWNTKNAKNCSRMTGNLITFSWLQFWVLLLCMWASDSFSELKKNLKATFNLTYKLNFERIAKVDQSNWARCKNFSTCDKHKNKYRNSHDRILFRDFEFGDCALNHSAHETRAYAVLHRPPPIFAHKFNARSKKDKRTHDLSTKHNFRCCVVAQIMWIRNCVQWITSRQKQTQDWHLQRQIN